MTHTALSKSAAIGVVGAGAMGRGIAQIAANAGHRVYLYDAVEGFAAKAKEAVGKGLIRLVEKGRMTEADRQALLDRIAPVDGLSGMASAKLVVEAVVENLDAKRKVFGELENICGKDVILATNTSSIAPTAIARDLKRPERLLGMHFFNPAPIMKLVEVVSGLATDPAIAATVHATAIAWGKTAVYAKSTPGFIVNRVARPFYAEGWRLLEEGVAEAATIDAVMRSAGGFRMGPFELMDLIGHDVNYAVTKSVFDAFYQDPRFRPSWAQQELTLGGFLGRKTGRGVYNYQSGVSLPLPQDAPAAPKPPRITVKGSLGYAHDLLDMCRNAGITIEEQSKKCGQGAIRVGEATLAPTDGRTATFRSGKSGHKDVNLILFDWAWDYGTTDRIVLAKAEQASDTALKEAVGLFQALGKKVSIVSDSPGLIALRTLAMLANEAADAVHWGVADAAGVDAAMRGGVNYPFGLLAWTDEFGLKALLRVLKALAKYYGDDRYRPSPLLRHKAKAGKKFHG